MRRQAAIYSWFLLPTLCFLCLGLTLSAQERKSTTVFSGIVMDIRSDEPMQYVVVKNLNTGAEVETLEQGQFSIPASKDDLLGFYYPGYRTDTLVVVEFDLKRVYLTQSGENFRLEEVRIEALTEAQLDAELERARKEGQIVETSQTRGGIRISPSRLFGQAGRQARERYELLRAEKDKRIVDARFSAEAIQALTPLNGEELDRFMIQFRPTLEFTRGASQEDFNLYIMDSFAKFKASSGKENRP